MTVINSDKLWEETSYASLALYRICFGLMGALGALRFFYYGWIDQLYIQPRYFFTYWGFDWVQPWSAPFMYAHFGLMTCAALSLAAGFYTRASALAYFLLFTYVELIDKTTYLNHYYFISLMACLMIFAPVGGMWSVDAWRGAVRASGPAWPVWLLRGQVGVVYVGAALAKVGPDWLVCGEPLGMWLSARSHWPVVGGLFEVPWLGLAMSWGGLVFDALVVPSLLWRRTRVYAYVAVVGFHLVTWALFPIGIFPWLMMISATLFFAPDWPLRLRGARDASARAVAPADVYSARWPVVCAALWMAAQIFMPLRAWVYPGDVHWGEQGFRFSWRVMVVEKTGHATFFVEEPHSGRRWEVFPSGELTPLQEKMMSTQPDMILAYAQHLRARFEADGVRSPRVTADVWVSWDGRPMARLIDPGVDLGAERDGLGAKPWILPAPQAACGGRAR